VAVLTRVNALLLAPQVALLTAGVPVHSALGLEVLERTGLRAALAYLRIATAPAGRIAADDVAEILRRPSRGLPQWFGDRVRRRSWWSIDALRGIANQVPDKEAGKVEWLVSDLELLTARARLKGATTRSVLGFIKDSVGLGGAMSLLDSSRGGEGSSHLDDIDALEQVAGLHPEAATFDGWLRSRLASDGSGPADGVTLSTVHRVKGMEWRRVAVFGVNAGILPHRLAEDTEEERRVLHVALTRCQDQVVLFADQTRPSPMLAELTHAAPARRAAVAGARVAESASDAAGGSGARPGRSGRVAAGRERPPRPEVDPVVEQALRAWRTERSRHDGVSAYIVMHDTTMYAIAAARPRSLVALRGIDGIGPAKLELYGDEVLAVLAGLEDQGAGASGTGPGAVGAAAAEAAAAAERAR
jgi:DNA helicase-2/ATP-dependent DNA helicase PcrA